MNETLLQYINALDDHRISDSRKVELQQISDVINAELIGNNALILNFICTHNSRRSILAQTWAQTAAAFYGKNNIYCYSAGTEETAVYPMIIHTLIQAGFEVSPKSNGENPVYQLAFELTETPIVLFSKRINHYSNPQKRFIAVMTCDQADQSCPIVPGADKRIKLMYEDPKEFDKTENEEQGYFEKSMEIANELFYIFSKLS
jgi:arsenate reductase